MLSDLTGGDGGLALGQGHWQDQLVSQVSVQASAALVVGQELLTSLLGHLLRPLAPRPQAGEAGHDVFVLGDEEDKGALTRRRGVDGLDLGVETMVAQEPLTFTARSSGVVKVLMVWCRSNSVFSAASRAAFSGSVSCPSGGMVASSLR